MPLLPQRSILVVDDVLDNRLILSRILSSHGYQVKIAESGEEAIRQAQELHPDLILLDIAMQDMDGFEVIRRLKKDELTRDMPVIFISALDEVDGKIKAFQAGGVDYILKPFDLDEVLARVELHLSIYNLRLQLEAANNELAVRVAELTHSQELLKQREMKLKAFIDALPNLSFIYDEKGRYLEILANEESLLSAKMDHLIGRCIEETLPPMVAETMMTAISRVIETGKVQVFEYKIPILTGEERWFEGRITLLEKNETGHAKVVLVATDVTERVRLFQKVQKQANLDPLTGCFNRRHFLTLADQEIQRSIRYQRPLSLFILDLDHFKEINDQYGHQAGDQVLSALVKLCRRDLRESDILGRYGGEEFIGLMPETSLQQAIQVSERLRGKIEQMQVDTPPGRISVTASFGVAALEKVEGEQRKLDMLISKADKALYAAKTSGRNSVSTV